MKDQMWIKAGVKCVEHGPFIEKETAKLRTEEGVWWSMQAMEREGEDAFEFENPMRSSEKERLVEMRRTTQEVCE